MDVLQQFAAVGAVIGLLITALWLLRARPRFRGAALFRRRQTSALECMGSLNLTAQHSVHLVRAGRQVLVLGAAPGTIAFLRELDSAAPIAPEERA